MDRVSVRGQIARVDGLPQLGMALRTTVPRRGIAIVAVAGECDLHDAPRLEAALVDAGRDEETRVLVDVSELRFADSTTLAALLKAKRALESSGSELFLVAPSPEVQRALAVAGFADRFRVLPRSEVGGCDADPETAVSQPHLAETATIFRAVNDRILELSEHWEAGESVHFFCECPDLRCTRPVPLSRDEYARIRSLPEPREIVHPAHVGPSRQVIEANDVYLVVSADGPAANDGPTGG